MTENKRVEKYFKTELSMLPEESLDSVECEDIKDICLKALEEIQQYRAIGTPDECRTAVERMKAMSTNENMITISLYFEVHDADLYGGEGTVGYANTNVDLKVSALGKADIDNYVEAQRQGVAEMCKVDKEKVIVISRTKYEEETADEDDWDDFDDDWSE